MIRVTHGQLELLQRNADTAVRARSTRQRQDLPENVLEAQICDALAWRGFTSVRQHVGLFCPYRVLKQAIEGHVSPAALRNAVRIGEEGMADWLSIRPVVAPEGRPSDGPWLWQGFYWECKAPGRKPTPAQLAWLERRRLAGFAATWFNRFDPDGKETCAPRDSHVFETWFRYFTQEHPSS